MSIYNRSNAMKAHTTDSRGYSRTQASRQAMETCNKTNMINTNPIVVATVDDEMYVLEGYIFLHGAVFTEPRSDRAHAFG